MICPHGTKIEGRDDGCGECFADNMEAVARAQKHETLHLLAIPGLRHQRHEGEPHPVYTDEAGNVARLAEWDYETNWLP